MKRNCFLSPILLTLATVFIACSSFVIYKVDTLRRELKADVNGISFASEVEQKAYRILSNFDFYAINSTNESVVKLVNECSPKASELGLNSIERLLGKVKNQAEVNISGQNTKSIQSALFQIEGKCKATIRQKRISTGETSIKLVRYWRFTYWLIGASCFLALLLSYTGYKVIKAKEKINGLNKMKTMFLNNSIDVVVTCDNQGRIVEYNKAAEKQFGYSFDEVYLKNVEFLYSNRDQARKVKEAINLNDSFFGEILNRKKNGEIFISQISANRVLNDVGKAIGSMGVSRDITKQKELETNYESIVNNVADIVYSTDPLGNFTFVNKAVTEVIGYTSEELIGLPFTSIIFKDHIAKVTEKYMNQFKNKEEITYNSFQVRCKDGSLIWISQSVRLIMSTTHKDHVVGVHGIARNVEEMEEI